MSTRQQGHDEARDSLVDYPIRVVNPQKKRDAKTYILKGMQLKRIKTLKCLQAEQLGKSVVSFQLNFDVGYMSGNQRICFREKDEIGTQLHKLANNSGQLWCEGIIPPSLKCKRSDNSKPVVIAESSSSDDDSVEPKQNKKGPI